MSIIIFFAMIFTISVKGIAQTADLFFESLHVASTESHTTVATHLIAQEADIAVAIVVAIIP